MEKAHGACGRVSGLAILRLSRSGVQLSQSRDSEERVKPGFRNLIDSAAATAARRLSGGVDRSRLRFQQPLLASDQDRARELKAVFRTGSGNTHWQPEAPKYARGVSALAARILLVFAGAALITGCSTAPAPSKGTETQSAGTAGTGSIVRLDPALDALVPRTLGSRNWLAGLRSRKAPCGGPQAICGSAT